MKIGKLARLDLDRSGTIVIPLFGGISPAAASAIGREFPELAQLLGQRKSLPEKGDALYCHAPSGRRQFLLVHAGRSGRPADARALACRIMAQLRERRVTRALIYICARPALAGPFLINLIDYLHLNNYAFDRYLRKKGKPVQRLDLFCRDKMPFSAAAAAERETINRSVVFCRDLVNEIPAKVTPDTLVQTATTLAREHRLGLTVFRKQELAEHGLNGLLAVGAASCCSPALIRLDYAPADARRRVAVVGKGITFDSGGLNIKPAGASMEEMKSDMAGAAVAMAVAQCAAVLRLPLQVTALAAVAENMPGGKAYKPGDIITYANKKTVEIVNTDAEGRLILADALIVASREKPDAIIEISTLTGAIVTALGDGIAGLMCRDKRLRAGLLQAGDACGELLWELPLFSEYRKDITAKVADLKNANYRGASSIKAGLFLSEFAGSVAFAHLDIAGTAFLSKPGYWLAAEGATGFGVRLLLEYLKKSACL